MSGAIVCSHRIVMILHVYTVGVHKKYMWILAFSSANSGLHHVLIIASILDLSHNLSHECTEAV